MLNALSPGQLKVVSRTENVASNNNPLKKWHYQNVEDMERTKKHGASGRELS